LVHQRLSTVDTAVDAIRTLAVRGADAIGIAGAYAVIWLLPNAMEFLRRYRPGIATYDNAHYGVFRFAWRPNLRWASVVLIMLLSCLYFISRQPPFLYMGF